MNYDYDPDNEPPITAAEVSMLFGLAALLVTFVLGVIL
jgi:hypothetical protein